MTTTTTTVATTAATTTTANNNNSNNALDDLVDAVEHALIESELQALLNHIQRGHEQVVRQRRCGTTRRRCQRVVACTTATATATTTESQAMQCRK
jgi:hypothetical protein